MTETEWDFCKDPYRLFDFQRPSAPERRLRLFICACCRAGWRFIPDRRSQYAVEAAERFANHNTTIADLLEAERGALCAWLDSRQSATSSVAALAWWASAQPPRVWLHPRTHGPAGDLIPAGTQSEYLRCVLGPPFQHFPPTKNRKAARIWKKAFDSWLTWNDGLVRRVAQASYDTRQLPVGTLDNVRLAVVADALEDAGCADADLLGHLRGPGPHVRGCWALDLVLGKS